MWPRQAIKGQMSPLPPQGMSVSHSHSHHTEVLMDLLGLVAED
jgi:hypothetical protein